MKAPAVIPALAVLGGWLCGLAATGQAPAADEGLSLTLGTTAFRDAFEKRNPALARWPDVRLRFDRPEEISWSLFEEEPRIRGIEFRLPMSFFWLGYEKPSEGEDPRATFSIQRPF